MAAKIDSTKNLVVGRGSLYFDKLVNGVYTGERPIGNAPDFTLTSSVDKLDHYSSESGFKEKDKSVNIETSRSGSMTTDNIEAENIALLFAGDYKSKLQSAQTDVKEKLNSGNAVVLGYEYQLGVDVNNPFGQGNIDAGSFVIMYAPADVAISLGTGDITDIDGLTTLPSANYELDPTLGRVYIEPDAPDLVGENQIVVQYDRKAMSQDVIVSADDSIEGALRFISDNPTGPQKNYYLPRVSLAPDGDFALLGDDWQQMSFTFEILKRDSNTQTVYVYNNGDSITDDNKHTIVLNANPTSIIADGTTASTITVTIKDSTNAPVIGANVTFSAIGGNLAATNGVTATDGTATTTFTSTTPGSATVTATEASSGNSKSVTIAVGADQSFSLAASVEPSAITADGSDAATVTATLTNGGTAVAGDTISFSATGGSVTPATATTSASGVATAKVTAAVAGTVTVTISDTHGDSKQLTVTANAVAPVDDFVLAASASVPSIPADGTTTSTITATLTNNGVAVSGEAITFSATGGDISATSGNTNSSGKTSATLTSDTEGTAVVTVSDTHGNTQTVNVTVTPVETADWKLTRNDAGGPAFEANGTTQRSLQVKLTKDGAPAPDETVTFTSAGGTLTETSAVTNSNGMASTAVIATEPGDCTITASSHGAVFSVPFIAELAGSAVLTWDVPETAVGDGTGISIPLHAIYPDGEPCGATFELTTTAGYFVISDPSKSHITTRVTDSTGTATMLLVVAESDAGTVTITATQQGTTNTISKDIVITAS